MGYKTIQQKRAELQDKQKIKYAFRDSIEELNKGLADIEKAINNLGATRMAIEKRISALDTGGVKEFEDYKKSLIAVAQGWGARSLPMTPVDKVISEASKELSTMISAYEDKLAAAFPREVKPGMTFKHAPLKRIYEIKTGPTQATNINLKGDNAIWFKVHFWTEGKDGGEVDINLTDLKKMKYLNT